MIVRVTALASFVAAALAFVPLAGTACVPQEARKCDYPHCHEWALGEGDEYVKNPSVKTKREYWAVARHGAYAYMFPRPDGFRTIAEECTANGANSELFRRYSLCATASSSADLARVNGMSVDDALAVSTFLHERLVFQKSSSTRIEPAVMLDDELIVCDENAKERAGTLKTICDRAYERRDNGGGGEVARLYTDAEVDALLPLLNAAYGVSR